MKLKLVVAFSIILMLSSASLALYGTRPMGMGGAFTAIADDANAAYWNPAGFALKPGVDITASTLTTNRNVLMGDNISAIKMCYEAPMSSPFEWILGVGAVSAVAADVAQYLGDQGVLKKNWGRNVEKTGREESMAGQVNAGGDQVTSSINPFKKAVPKPGARTSIFGPIENLSLNFNLNPRGNSYWYNRYDDPSNSPVNKAQFALGLTWLNDNNPPNDMLENWYTVSVASAWEERVAVGANVNLYDLKVISTGIKGFGAGVDIGAIGKPLPNFSIGIDAKEPLTTDINWQNGVVTRYEMMINAGVAIDPVPGITLAADKDNILSQNGQDSTMHYGVEVRPIDGLALRAGLYDQSKTAGASVGIGGLIVDYAYLGGAFDRTQMVGATWMF